MRATAALLTLFTVIVTIFGYDIKTYFTSNRIIITCDGVTDIAPAVQAISNRLARDRASEIALPNGICRVASPVVFTTAVQLGGQGYTEGATEKSVGTMLKIDKTGFVPFTFSGPASRGSVVRNLGVYQVHHHPSGVGWKPDDYDYVFKVLNALGGVEFNNVMMNGVNRGIYALNSGRLNVTNVIGQFYTTGIEIDHCLDIPHIGRLHSWTFATSDKSVLDYQTANLDLLLLKRVDGIFIDDIFAIDGRSSIRFTSGREGVTHKAYISNLYSDLTKYGVWVDRDGAGVMFQIANMTHQGNDPNHGATPLIGSSAIQIDAPNVSGQIGNLRSDITYDNAISITAIDVQLDIFSLIAKRFNSRNNSSPAINALSSDSVRVGFSRLIDGNGGDLFKPSFFPPGTPRLGEGRP